jgi:hypothetical protein
VLPDLQRFRVGFERLPSGSSHTSTGS